MPLASVLSERGILAAEALDELRRGHVEASVLRMFTWPTGEFSFEIQDSSDDAGEDLFVPGGMNPQFLALEGTRLHDEARSGTRRDDDGGGEVMTEDSLRLGHEGEDEDVSEAPLAGDPILVAEALDDEGEPSWVPSCSSRRAPSKRTSPKRKRPRRRRPRRRRRGAPRGACGSPRAGPPRGRRRDRPRPRLPRVAEGRARALPSRVHIFQRSDQGISRIRQYLARAETPLVVLRPTRRRTRSRARATRSRSSGA